MRPTPRALALVSLVALLAFFSNESHQLWAIVFSGALLVLLSDLYRGYRLGRRLAQDGIKIRRRLTPNMPVNRVSEVVIELNSQIDCTLEIRIFDHYPDSVEAEGMPINATLSPHQKIELVYRITPTERGNVSFGKTELLLLSPFGLWQVKNYLGGIQQVRVYPDFSIISRYLELVSDRQVHQLGIKLAPRRGDGLEFHQLREYRAGDALRQVDWKATARHSKLISREYQEERDQQVLFLLDSGRRMRSQDDALSHFDHALNAVLLLAYVALKQGDSVSALTFGSDRRWLAPMRGVNAINRLLSEIYDLQCGLHTADYISAAEEVLRTQRKRALVILLTNLREEDEDLAPALKLMRGRHVVVLANLTEEALEKGRHRPITDFADALEFAGTMQYLIRHRERHKGLSRLADIALEVTPPELPVAVVNSYWQIKRSGIL